MLSIICGVDFKESSDKFSKTKSFRNLINAKYEESLASSSHLKEIASLLNQDSSEPYEAVKNYLSQVIEKCTEDDQFNELVELGISCLQLFLQTNWLGPLQDYMKDFAKADQDQRLIYYLGASNNEVTSS